MNHQGRLTRWNDDKGFGFIKPSLGGQEVFAHISAYKGRGRPKASAQVAYQLGMDEQGRPRVTRFRVEGAGGTSSAVNVGVWVSLLVALGVIGGLYVAWQQGVLPWMLLAMYLGMSLLAFLSYWTDKQAARRGAWRVTESTLHLMELTCGWPGAWFAQQLLRHKTRKRSYQVTFWCAVLLNIGAVGWLVLSPDASSLRQMLGFPISTGDMMIKWS
ncbi:DUF1294 domain-containing protein [Cobetia sp. L2A1]|uniref:DUF1294 domain-containing protein n=1 Tax=Cobetia sp. L2A1 TaxID=2686360 RepID=UPI00131D15DA|nr:cold shock and DUF1294 domain-containing protein [Cobetia sp. L2A1]